MIPRITKIIFVGAMLFGLTAAVPGACAAWSWNPFSSGNKKEATQYTSGNSQKAPSVWDKTVAGTKNFFNKTGETLGLKKPEKKKYKAAYANRKPIKSDKNEKPLFGWLQPEEDKPKDVKDWMGRTSQITP